ncbi:MAG: NUDIX domain-containing protein [Thermotogae bacterium]|jgi:8-oxo-dGTP diphosphatase|nr:NUDIX domain-containing protein [Thermotogota bacterium]MCL5032842.1 NUDIX domain-containing protein [Thermotogota bacterium]
MENERFSKIVVGGLGIVINSKGEVLFIKQKNGPYAGNWLLPGGSVEYGETALNAAKREIMEETGIKVEDGKFIATYEMIGEWKAGKYHILMITFLFKSDLEIPTNFKGHNVDGIVWANPQNISLHPTDMLILKDAGLLQISDEKIKSSLRNASITMNSYK